MSVNTEGTDETTQQPETTGNEQRQHVEANEISNGGLDLPVGEPKSDAAEAEREGDHKWTPEGGNQ